MTQKRVERAASSEAEETETPSVPKSTLTDEIDGVLEEIDQVLEANAAEFVRGYIQKGGE